MSIKGRSEKRDFMNNKSQLRSNKPLRCFICHKEGHFKIDLPKRRKRYKDKEREGISVEASIAYDKYESVEAFTMVGIHYHKDWILDSGCSYQPFQCMK